MILIFFFFTYSNLNVQYDTYIFSMVVRSNEQITNYYFAKNCVSKNIWFFLRLKMHATSTPKLIADWRGGGAMGRGIFMESVSLIGLKPTIKTRDR